MAHNLYEGRFGNETLFPIENDQIDIISHHYQAFLNPSIHQLDTTTWQDLDMDVMYKKMNMTYCGAGDIMLYGMLHQPCVTKKALDKRFAIMEWARTEETERESVISILSKAGKRFNEDIQQPFLECHAQNMRKQQSYMLLILLAIMLLCAVVFGGWFIVAAVLVAIANFIRYWILHKKLEPYLDSLVYMIEHMEVLHKLANIDFKGIPEIRQEAQELSEKVSVLRKSSSLSYFEDVAGIFNPLSQKESRLFDTYSKFIYEHSDLVKEAFAFVGTLDACISMASYSVYEQVLYNIEVCENQNSIFATDMIHPLVKKCVANDVDIQENRLLTGSNATGKSTYLKMIALNAILAQSFHFVFAKSYRAGFFQIATSMSIHDDIEEKVSTFVAEVKSLKYLLDIDDQICPTLCVIDEILRGTNTLERIASSSAILRQFAKRNGLCLSATHDIELTHILKKEFKNYHFSEQMKEERMVFDYKIHDGITTTRNAIALLSIFGYDASIVEHAKQRLSSFERKGSWEVIS